MSREIKDFKTYDEALIDERQQSSSLSPRDRILLLHRLIAVWMKFPRLMVPTDGIPIIKRIK
jgi:hypothetical protein